MAINELAARYAKEGIVSEETVYVPVVCSSTGKTFYYKFCLYPHMKPTWLMMEVCLEAPANAGSSSPAAVDMTGYRTAEEMKCPFCGTIGYGSHVSCGTVFCREFGSSAELYCPKCKTVLVPCDDRRPVKGIRG